MRENELIEQQELREQMIDRVEVLDKVGELLLLPNTEFATLEQVAKYYKADTKTIEQVSIRNSDELKEDGYGVQKQSKILEMLNLRDSQIERLEGKAIVTYKNQKLIIPNRGMKLFSKKAILRVALLLKDSEVANEIKIELGVSPKTNMFLRKEIEFKKELDSAIEEIRKELRLNIGALPSTNLYKNIYTSIENLTRYIPQYGVCNNKYRIDFYFPLLNLAVEFDENYHKNQVIEDDVRKYEIIREIYINKYLKSVTKDDLDEFGYNDIYELYDIDFKENNLECNFDLTRFIRIKESYEIQGLIKLVVAITNKASEIISSRGMSCNYDDLLELNLAS